ncbi:hypothetical protein ACFYOV_19915 [Streptomyces sp. NPDC005931]|uniref:hypothetical protein n=1 Tax=Streptomyces sp. NPDC005931 TaxID=3364737 RepID=UPI0036AAD1AE
MTQQSQEMPTCFVISPIGAEESDVRVAADDFLELLLEPVLSSYRFKVVRADRMATPTAITTDIVRLVQEAELCIIDLTGHNANVFYECGRRHETGRPFIQMVSKSWEERLPFDVAGIRTLTYDLSSPRAVLISQNALRAFIDAIASGEVDQRSTGASMSTVAQSLQRIERKLDTLTSARSRNASSGHSLDNLDLLVMPPREAWYTCMRAGDLVGATAQLDRLKRAGDPKEYLAAVGLLLAAGHEEAFPRMESEINTLVDRINAGELDGQDWAALAAALAGLRGFFANYGRAREGVTYVRRVISRLPDDDEHSEELARMYNIVGMLAWVCSDFDTVIEYTSRAFSKFDGEPAYVYNLLLAYKETRGQDDPAFQQWLDRLAAYDRLPPEHQEYLAEHGRVYSGGTIKESSEGVKGDYSA